MAVGHYPEHCLSRERFDLPETGLQDFNIAAKFIDDETLDARLLSLGEELHRPVERGKHPAAVYITD